MWDLFLKAYHLSKTTFVHVLKQQKINIHLQIWLENVLFLKDNLGL